MAVGGPCDDGCAIAEQGSTRLGGALNSQLPAFCCSAETTQEPFVEEIPGPSCQPGFSLPSPPPWPAIGLPGSY